MKATILPATLAPRARGVYKLQFMTPSKPQAAGRVLRLAAVTLVVGGAALVLLIALGAFDPRPLGPPAGSDRPGPLSLAVRGEMLRPQPWPFAATPARRSIHLTAAYVAGEADSGYGLALGEQGALTVAVSPLGEVAVWEATAGAAPRYWLPWQPWPHVRPGAATNELWLDVDTTGGPTRVTAWINRERLWQGEVAPLSGTVALWLGSFGGPVTVDFAALAWYGDD